MKLSDLKKEELNESKEKEKEKEKKEDDVIEEIDIKFPDMLQINTRDMAIVFEVDQVENIDCQDTGYHASHKNTGALAEPETYVDTGLSLHTVKTN